MSINLKYIYFRHFLKNDNLKNKYSNNSIFFKDPHHYFNIENTIHYKTLITNNFNDYNKLIISTNQKEHSNLMFKELLCKFDVEKINKIKITYDLDKDIYYVLDGTHRIIILKFKNLIKDNINLQYMDIIFDNETLEVLREKLGNTVGKSHYNGWNNRTTFGYHSFNIYNFNVNGQRIPKKRFEKIKKYYDFKGKSVIDFGCNNGGMLFHIPEIKKGLGLDYDENCINFANYFKNILKYDNELTFIKQDLNTFNFQGIEKVDIIFLLSLGSWVKNWKELYKKCLNYCDNILLETNNDEEGKPQLELFKELNCKIQIVSDKSDDDTTGNLGRKTYLISK